MTSSNNSSPRGSEVSVESQRGMTIEVSQNEEIFGREKMEREDEWALLSVGEQRIGGA